VSLRLFGMGASIALALVFAPALHVSAIETPYAALEVAPARVELAVVNTQAVRSSFVVANLSTSAETVQIVQADFTIASATYQFMQAGSTPWSIAAGLQLSKTDLLLPPLSQAAVQLTYTPITQTALRAGVLIFIPTIVGPARASSGGAGAVIKQQVVVPVLAVPAGSDGQLDTRVTLSGIPTGMELLDAFTIGGISFLESGPIRGRATFRNTGNAIGRFDTFFVYSNLGRDFLSTEAPPGVALPGQSSSAMGSTKVTLPGQGTVDTTPMFCICRVHASSSLVLLGQRSPETSQDRYVVIAPWRALGLLMAVLGGVWWGVGRRRRS
jgi:hypothetical protein